MSSQALLLPRFSLSTEDMQTGESIAPFTIDNQVPRGWVKRDGFP